MDGACIFFIQIPQTQQFCHVVLKIDSKLLTGPQTQTLKCRQLLFFCREVIVSPNFYDDSLLDVVMSVAYFKERKIRPFCQKLDLQPVRAGPAMPNVMQECFTYTLRFRISSSYNLISNILVKGSDVLNCKEKQEAVDLDIVVSVGQIAMTVRPMAIRNPPSSLDNFDICFQALQNFRQDPESTIEEFSIYRSWCHVMPSMKRGQLVRVCHKIPIQNQIDEPRPSFSDYTGLKKYWKNHHGLHLPESEEGMLYGSIYFKLIGRQLFTYPLCCLRTRPMQILSRCDGSAVIKDFVNCLHQRMDRVCGFLLVYSSKTCYPTASISTVSQIKVCELKNVTTSDPITKKVLPRPSTSAGDVSMLTQNSMKHILIPSQKPCGKKTMQENTILSSQVHGESRKEDSNIFASAALKDLPMTVDGKYIPVFTRKQNAVIRNSSHCAKKIDFENVKKKKMSCTKKGVVNGRTPKQAVRNGRFNLGVVMLAAAGKKYEMPSQVQSSLNGRGYSPNETATLPNPGVKNAKGCQSKKLSLDNTSNSPMQNKAPPSRKMKFMQRKWSPLKISHVFDTSKVTSNRSPLKIIKDHFFDKLFSSASGTLNKAFHHPRSGSAQNHHGTCPIRNKGLRQQKYYLPAKHVDSDGLGDTTMGFAKHLSSTTQEAKYEVDDGISAKFHNGLRGHQYRKIKVNVGNHSFDKLFMSASNYNGEAELPTKQAQVVSAARSLPDSVVQSATSQCSNGRISKGQSKELISSLEHVQQVNVSTLFERLGPNSNISDI